MARIENHTFSLEEAFRLAAFDSWNAASIDQRHALLMALAKDIWKTSPIDS